MRERPNSFSYATLNTTNHEIRLIHLQPRQVTSEIECEITVEKLHSMPPYEALSYEWGRSNPTKFFVKLNGRNHPVRENLRLALDHLRLIDSPRTLWIDALCINQDNINERNQQVAQMGSIYSRATRVIAWIGLEQKCNFNCPGGQVIIATAILQQMRRFEIEESFATLRDSEKQAQVESLLELCSRSYWTRLWVIQELVLAPTVLVQCGAASLDFELLVGVGHGPLHVWLGFANGVKFEESSPRKLLWLRNPTKCKWMEAPPGDVMAVRKTHSRLDRARPLLSGNYSVLELMREVPKSYCEDTRDKVFGLLGLSPKCCQNAIRPNYSQSLIEICEIALKHHVSQHAGQVEDAMNSILEGLGLEYFKKIGEHWPVIQPSATSLKKRKGSDLMVLRNLTFHGRIIWIFEQPNSWRRPLRIPSLPNELQATFLAALELATSDEIAARISSTEPVEGEQLYFNPKSDFPLTVKGSKSYFEALGTGTPKTKESNILSKMLSIPSAKNPDKHLKQNIDRLWQAWEAILGKGVEKLAHQKLSVFFTDQGKVGFGTRGCKVGNLICEVHTGTEQVAVLNATSSRNEIIGKGILMRGAQSSRAVSRSITMYVDLATFLFLNGCF